VQVFGLTSSVQAITAGAYPTCALVSGGARCWGYNGDGELGNGSTTNSPVPVQVSGLASGVQTITAGGYHTCALVSGGVQCWGYNGDGELGNNSTSDSPVPVQVALPPWL
jgi:alpha-tubulin suppressor-like RCC1 family protein